MNYIDIVFLIILLISAGISFWRGFVREFFSLVGWFVAAWVAIHFAPKAQDFGVNLLDSMTLRVIVAFVLLFVITLIIFAVVNHLLAQMIDKAGLSAFNRIIGLGFGFMRGVLIVVMIMLVGNFIDWPDKKTRAGSFLYPYAAPIAEWVRQKLPSDIGSKLTMSAGLVVEFQLAELSVSKRTNIHGSDLICAV